MKYSLRSCLTATAVIGLMGGAAAIGTAPTYAQNAQMLAPVASWAVSSLGQGGDAYCALARRFDQNTILTLARNGGEETSFALDFQRPVFPVGRSMNVVLDPGAGQQRAYKVTPASSQAFVARMGRDAAFFNALEKTGFLRVVVGTQAYHFNISDVSAGQSKLESCLVSMVMPAAGDEMESADASMVPMPGSATPAAKPAQPQIDLSNFRAEINTLRRQVATLKKQNIELNEQVASGDASAQVEMLNKRIENLSKANDALTAKLAEAGAPKSTIVRSEASGAGADAEALRQENLRLKAELQTLNPDQDKLAEFSREIESLEAENARLNASLRSVDTAKDDVKQRTAQLEARVRELESENAQLHQQVASAESGVPMGDAETVALRKEVEDLRAENASLKTQLAAAGTGGGADEGLVAELQKQLAELKAENEFLEKTSAQIKIDLAAAHNEELDALKAELAAKDGGSLQELASLRADVERLQGENQDLLVKMSENDEAKNTIATLQADLEKLEAEKSDFEAQLSALRGENDSMVQQLAAQKNAPDTSGQLATLEEENAALKDKLAAAQESAAKIASLGEELEGLRSENAEMTQKLSLADSTQQDLATAQEKNAELKASLSEVITLAENYKAEAQEAINAQQDGDDASEKIAAAESRIASLEKDMTGLQLENQRLEAQLVSASRDTIGQQAQDNAANDEVLQKKIAMLQDQLEMVKAQKAKEVSEVQQQYAMLEKRVMDESVDAEAANIAAAQTHSVPEKAARAPVPTPENIEQAAVRNAAAVQRQTAQAQSNIPHAEGVSTYVQQSVRAPAPERVQEEVLAAEEIAGLNQAQIHELRMKKRLERDGGQAQAMLQASKAEDPFEGMSVTPEQAYADVVKEELRPVDPAPVVDDVMDDIPQALPALPSARPEAPKVAVSSPALGGGMYQPAFDVGSVLSAGGSVQPGSLRLIEEASGPQRVAYQWVTANNVYGSAEQRPISSPNAFDTLVMEYLERTESRCPGEFAVSADQTSGDGDARADSYEVACIANGISSSASLLFFTRNGTFTTMAYEAPTEKLMDAMDNRNEVMQIVQNRSGGWTLASR